MKKKILILFLFVGSICIAQKEAIELPKGYGFTVKYSKKSITPLFSIYINKKGDVTLENIKIPNIEQLGDSLLKYREQLRPEFMPWLITLIHADKNTSYKHVENVKSQMSSALLLSTIYRTGHIEDINSGLGVRLNRKSLIPEKKLPAEENTDDMFFEDIGIIEDPIFRMVDDLYDLKFSNAKKILKSYKYKKVTFYNDKKLIINGQKIRLTNKQRIFQELKDTNFIFTFPSAKMTYETYIKNVSILVKIYEENKMTKAFIEISSDLQKIMKKKKVKL